MSKEFLRGALEQIGTANNYIWSLYFFSIDNRSKKNPFKASKAKFKDQNYLLNYGVALASSILRYQIEKVDTVEEYHGENPKISCDKLSVTSDLINKAWNNLETAITNSDTEISGKVKGYILCANPPEESDSQKTIMFIKKANPIIEVKNKRSILFTLDAEDNLDDFSKKTFKFYLNTDCIIIEDMLYAFNLNFEEIFSLDKTLLKLKKENIQTLVDKELFCPSCSFEEHLNGLSSKSYGKFDESRLLAITDVQEIERISSELSLNINNNKIILNNKDEATRLVDYLNLKIIKENETGTLYKTGGRLTKYTIG